MAPSRKRRKCNRDTSHTFLVSLDVTSPCPAGPVAVADKVSLDYRRTLPQVHMVRPPTPPAESFFDDFNLDDECNHDFLGDVTTRPVIIDFPKESIIDRKKPYASSVSKVLLFISKV